MISSKKLVLHLLLVAQLIISKHAIDITSAGALNDTEFLPEKVTEYRSLQLQDLGNGGGVRRVLAPFQLCLTCRCCAANDPSNCSTMPCCFRISCDLPDKPYGVCAFVPKICNCTSCT